MALRQLTRHLLASSRLGLRKRAEQGFSTSKSRNSQLLPLSSKRKSQLMPSSKSSTSSEKENELRKAAYKQWAEEKNYEALLTDLLAEVHRDGGQYTTLTGYAES